MISSGKVRCWYKLIWECNAPIKVKIFYYLVIGQRILTHEATTWWKGEVCYPLFSHFEGRCNWQLMFCKLNRSMNEFQRVLTFTICVLQTKSHLTFKLSYWFFFKWRHHEDTQNERHLKSPLFDLWGPSMRRVQMPPFLKLK